MLIPAERWKHFAAMVLIGDGVMAVIHPERDAAAWKAGPRSWRTLMERFQEHPALTRLIGAAQIVAGVTWALSQEAPAEAGASRSR